MCAGVRRYADGLHTLDISGGGEAAADDSHRVHVHLPGSPRVLHPAAIAQGTHIHHVVLVVVACICKPRLSIDFCRSCVSVGILGLRRGFPGGERFLLPLLLGARRRGDDRIVGHEEDEASRHGVDLRLPQPPAGHPTARLEGPLHHRLGRWCRRRIRVRRPRRKIRGEQIRRRHRHQRRRT